MDRAFVGFHISGMMCACWRCYVQFSGPHQMGTINLENSQELKFTNVKVHITVNPYNGYKSIIKVQLIRTSVPLSIQRS